MDRLLAAAEAWQHSDEAPAKRAALAAVQEIALARCGPPGSPECAAQGFPLAAAAPPDSADPCSTALSPAQALPPSVAAYLLPGTSTRLTKLLISAVHAARSGSEDFPRTLNHRCLCRGATRLSPSSRSPHAPQNQSGAVEATAALASAVVAALRPEGADGDRVEEGVEHRVARTPQWVAETRPRVLRLLELACHSLQAGGASGPPAPLLRCAAADLALRISLADASNASNASADASATATASGGSALSFFEDSPLLSELLLALSADSWPQVRLLASSHLRRLSALSGERARGSRLAAAALRRALSSAADAAASGAPAAATLQLLRTARGALEAHGPEIASLELADRADSCGEVWAALGRILEPSRCRPLPQQDRQRSGDEAGPAGAAAAGRGLIGRFVEFRWLADEARRGGKNSPPPPDPRTHSARAADTAPKTPLFSRERRRCGTRRSRCARRSGARRRPSPPPSSPLSSVGSAALPPLRRQPFARSVLLTPFASPDRAGLSRPRAREAPAVTDWLPS